MSLTREQILETVAKVQEHMRDSRGPQTIIIHSEFGTYQVGSQELHVLMDEECLAQLQALPAGYFEPRLYVPAQPPIIRKHQPPYWAHDWRRGRKGKGR